MVLRGSQDHTTFVPFAVCCVTSLRVLARFLYSFALVCELLHPTTFRRNHVWEFETSRILLQSFQTLQLAAKQTQWGLDSSFLRDFGDITCTRNRPELHAGRKGTKSCHNARTFQADDKKKRFSYFSSKFHFQMSPFEMSPFPAAPAKGRNLFFPEHLDVRVRNLRQNSGPKCLCLRCFNVCIFPEHW